MHAIPYMNKHHETALKHIVTLVARTVSGGNDRMGRRIQGRGRHDAALLRPGPRLRLRTVVEALHAGPVRRRQPPRRLLRRPLLRLRLRRAHGPLRAQLPSPGRRRPVQARRDAGPRRLGRRDHAMLLSPQRRRQARWQRRGAGLLVVHHRVLAGDAEQHARRGRAAAGRHVRRLGARPRRADIDGADHRLLPAAAAGLRGEAGLRWRRREAGHGSLAGERGQRCRGWQRRGEEAAPAGLAAGESRRAQGGAESQRLRGRPRSGVVVRHKQVAHPDTEHHRGFRADHVPDWGWTCHVQHGPVHGAAGEDHRLRGRHDRAGHGSAVRGRSCGHRRRSRRSGAPGRRPASCHHAGCSSSINYHLGVRQGVWRPR